MGRSRSYNEDQLRVGVTEVRRFREAVIALRDGYRDLQAVASSPVHREMFCELAELALTAQECSLAAHRAAELAAVAEAKQERDPKLGGE